MPADQMQTLNRAIAVLDCFTQESSELGVREVARRLNLSTSAAGRLLTALKTLGVLSQNPETRAYSIGPRVLSWAEIYNASLDLRNAAATVSAALHAETGETISLYLLEDDQRVCIQRLESAEGVRIVSRIGRRLPLYAGSAGKAMLAFLPPEQQDAILRGEALQPLTSQTIIDPQELRRALADARARGCAVSSGEWIEGAAGVAAPIFDRSGRVIAAISISGPVQRFQPDKLDGYCRQVRAAALEISVALGYRPSA